MPSPHFHTLRVHIERWPIAGCFTISRGAKTDAVVVVAELSDGAHLGRGECVPYPRYGETPEGAVATIETLREPLAQGLDRLALQMALPAGAARNALDCAFWDIEAKRSRRPAYTLAELPAPQPRTTAYTILLANADEMAQAVSRALPSACSSRSSSGHPAMRTGSPPCTGRRCGPS